jgi:hypothetical protein
MTEPATQERKCPHRLSMYLRTRGRLYLGRGLLSPVHGVTSTNRLEDAEAVPIDLLVIAMHLHNRTNGRLMYWSDTMTFMVRGLLS